MSDEAKHCCTEPNFYVEEEHGDFVVTCSNCGWGDSKMFEDYTSAADRANELDAETCQ